MEDVQPKPKFNVFATRSFRGATFLATRCSSNCSKNRASRGGPGSRSDCRCRKAACSTRIDSVLSVRTERKCRPSSPSRVSGPTIASSGFSSISSTPLAAHAAIQYKVELGNRVTRAQDRSPLTVDDSGDRFTITTGPLKVAIDKNRFHLFDGVWINGEERDVGKWEPVARSSPEGVRLIDEHGTPFTMSGRPPKSVRIETQGPRKVVVRVEGVYGSGRGQGVLR